MKENYLADAAKEEMQRREDSGQSATDMAYIRDYFEAGYALLRAARLHDYELPVDNSKNALPVVFQSSLDVVSINLVRHKSAPTPFTLALIYSTAKDILAINHPDESTNSAEKLMQDFNEARKLSLQEKEADHHVEAAERILGLRK